MTITMERALRRDTGPAVALDPVGGYGPGRGTVQRTAMVTLVAAIIFQPILHPSGPGNISPVDLFTVASVISAAVCGLPSKR